MRLLALLALVLAGFGGNVPNSVSSVRDSAGVKITTSHVSDQSADAVCALAETSDMRVASPASGEWTFFQIEDLDRMEDGRLVVVNRGSRQLLVFGPDGHFLQAIGRRGEGPGEFLDPIEVGFFAGDSIVVWDWDLGRLELFGPDGSHGRSVRLRPPMLNPTGRFGVLGQEGLALGNHDVRGLGSPQLTPQFLQVLRYDWSGALIDTLATLPYGERGLADPETRTGGRPPFESRGVFSTHDDLLYTSHGSSPEVRIHREGQLESIVRWDPGDLTVRDEDVEAYKAARIASWEGVDDRWASILRASLDAFPAKDTFPAVAEIQIDDQGRIWIRTFDRPRSAVSVWLGFTDTGDFICSLSVPRDLKIFRFDLSAVVGVHRDEMDVEFVEVRSFQLPSG